MDLKIRCWNIRGLSTSDKQKEVRNFIREESLSVCAIVETHLKAKRIQKIGDQIYGDWDCEGMFCAIIYAANGGMERRTLWKYLMIYKRIVGPKAWFLMGDINVTLLPNEHSASCSNMTSDMCDSRDCVNNIKIEDIASTGLFYTWTKNLFKAKAVLDA
nr:hypothetical protein [Tanacetum cinerariifolium]